ncbi:HEPN domain-containing protein [Variovorax sp. Varisp36]|uniref:HEPN domain-containing protein n=1 Tax=Variovorax sp. Varisp36 TaxID=3243031 RepID=UPI0039A4E5E6
MPRITHSELLLISKANQEKLKNFADGVLLSARANRSISQLQWRVAEDRILLARRHLRDAKLASRTMPSLTRAIVSRAYYSMYHAARAATYVYHKGDDHEAHTALATKLPSDFPNCDIWKMRLKEARFDRNRADYDPYPLPDSTFKPIADRLLKEAKELIPLAAKYIKSKKI